MEARALKQALKRERETAFLVGNLWETNRTARVRLGGEYLKHDNASNYRTAHHRAGRGDGEKTERARVVPAGENLPRATARVCRPSRSVPLTHPAANTRLAWDDINGSARDRREALRISAQPHSMWRGGNIPSLVMLVDHPGINRHHE